FHPNPGGAIETMVDLSGRGYSSLQTAFKYRKIMVEGCRCHPQPWSETELARHRAYAEDKVAGAEKPPTQAEDDAVQASPMIGAAETPAAIYDGRALARPGPVIRQIDGT